MVIWTPCDRLQPRQDGTYLVTTAKGKVRFDRFVDGEWGLCNPQLRGGYRPHAAWAAVPEPYKPKKRNI